jgi:hypothetical protein
LGGVPLMLGTGTGSEIRQPLGYSIVGGLMVSQLLTLYTTPVVYLYLDGLGKGLRGLRRRMSGWTAASRPTSDQGRLAAEPSAHPPAIGK